jgi:hypothetical protein
MKLLKSIDPFFPSAIRIGVDLLVGSSPEVSSFLRKGVYTSGSLWVSSRVYRDVVTKMLGSVIKALENRFYSP